MADFSLIQTPNFAQAALGGYQAGRQIGQQKRMDAALQLYASDPDAGAHAVMQIDPEQGYKLQELARQKQIRELTAKAMTGGGAEPAGAIGETAPGAAPGMPTAQTGLQINMPALQDLAKIDPQSAIAVQNFAKSANAEQVKQVTEHLQQKGQWASYFARFPEGPERTQAFHDALPQLQTMFTPQELAQADLSDKMLVRDQALAASFAPQTELQKDANYMDSVQPGLGRTYLTNKANPLVPVKGIDKDGNETLTFERPSAAGTGSPPVSAGAGSPTGAGIIAGHNHGAIKDGPFARSQPGYTGASGDFATFKDDASGNAAQENLLRSKYLSKGLDTPTEIVRKYAPLGKENSASSVNNYIDHVARSLGIGPNDQITEAQLPALAQAMRGFETGKRSAAPKAGKPDSATLISQANAAIAAGADPDKVHARLRQLGVE